ncbi:Ig-like domain-containing protein [Lederbergia panacisoli]|uniref:Ig-like domain-containing protein n=1 Tax=Lederbergia panacisoli TaxID=1255251 RepID=UPI00214BAF8F|nr:Ig-like domain-containing protein [Lederbergia panacisoli]MCR2823789.1 Ig-like domain-containing protein [Lederbergia panacisoli]
MKRLVCLLLCGVLLLQPIQGSAQEINITETSSLFNQNLELGGFETGGYDREAIQPTTYNWTRQSGFIGWSEPAVNWTYKTEGSFRTSPVIGADGTIYISSTDGNLYAVSKGGELKWKKYIGTMEESPVIGNGGLLYIVSQQGVVNALDKDGNTVWQYTMVNQYQPAVFTQPVIGKDGSIFIAANYKLYALSSSGNLKWTLNTGDFSVSNSPAIGLDGTIYAVYGKKLLAVSQYGTKKWEYTNNYNIHTAPLVREDGLIYYGTEGEVVTLTPDGKNYGNPYNVYASSDGLALGRDGQFYFSGSNGTLYMRSSYPYPVKSWEFHTGDTIWSAPIIDYMGTIYFVTDRGYIYAVKKNGSRKWSINLGTDINTRGSLSIGKDGTLYIGGKDGRLYAVGGKLADLKINDFYDNSSELAGTAPANSTVIVQSDNVEIGSGTTDSNGTFTVSLTKQSAGTELKVYAKDEYGNKSSETVTVVKDGTPPPLSLSHEINVTSADISGTSEAGVIIIAKKGTDIIEKTTADSSGRFSIAIPSYPEGTELEISATDQAGNRTIINVTVIKDTVAPEMPIVEDINDQTTNILGTAEPGSTVIALVAGKELGKAVADKVTGQFSIEIKVQDAGKVIQIVARDDSGNTSIAAEKTVRDITPPKKPEIRSLISNLTSVVNGITEGDATVEIRVGDKLLGSEKANRDGSFHISIDRQEAGKVIVVEAIDAAGNRSRTEATVEKIEGTYRSGGIYEDEVWTKENSPYIVTSDITVFPDVFLTIEPGVEVRFAPNVRLTVRGKLISEGSANQKILMSMVATGSYNDDRWNGIYVDGENSFIKLKHTEIQSANTALGMARYYVDQDERIIELDHVTFSNNKTAIWGNINYKQMFIRNSMFTSNETAISGPTARISNSSFRNNRSALESGIYEVYHSSFTNNRYAIKGSSTVIEDNQFSFNENAIEGAGNSIIRYNTFENNGMALILKGRDTAVYNTFKNNSTGLMFDTNGAKVNHNNIFDSISTTIKDNIDIKNNWWGTDDQTAIKDRIYDGYDNINLGLVNFSPVLTSEVDLANYNDAVWPEGSSVVTWSPAETVIDVSLSEGYYFDIIKNYRISVNNKVVAIVEPDKTGKLNYSIKNLKPDTLYNVKVEFQNDLGDWSQGISKEVTTIDTTAPTWPVNSKLKVVKENGIYFEIEWTKAIDTSEISEYAIYLDGRYYDSVPADVNNFAFKEYIYEHTSYNVAVIARDNSHQSTELKTSLTTGEYVPPGGIFIEVNPFTDNDKVITGKTEPNLLVNAFVYEDGKLYTEKYAYADDKGNFKVDLPFKLWKYEHELELKVSDYENNNWSTVKVPIIDTVHPGIDVSPVTEKDTIVKGRVGDNGGSVKVYVMKGITKISDTITVENANSFSDFSLKIPIQIAGTELTIWAEDVDGNKSDYTLTVEDVTPPVTPTISTVSNLSTSISGKTEPRAKVKLYLAGIYQQETTADTKGAYSFKIAKQKAGTEVKVTAEDKSGNMSSQKTIVLDKIAPTVSGPVNNGYYNRDVTIRFNEGKATLNGSAIKSGTVVKTAKVYTLVVTDAAGNKTTVKFTIDKTAPKVSGAKNNAYYKKNVKVTFNEGKATLNRKAFKSGTIVKNAGVYTLVVTDTAGNKTTTKFTIDKTAPKVSGVSNNAFYNKNRKITFNEGKATLNKKSFKKGTIVKTSGVYTLVVTDSASNKTTIKFTIDKKAPAAPKVNKVKSSSSTVSGTAEAYSVITIKVGKKTIGTAKTSKSGKFKVKIPKQKKKTTLYVTAKDRAGNSSKSTKTIVY